MDSYIETQYHNNNSNNNQHDQHQHQHHQHQNSGLLRYRSAPSSLFFDNIVSPNETNECFRDENGCLETYEKKPLKINGSGSGSGVGQLPPQYPKGNIGLNLNRQSSSPAGFFSQLNTQNAYSVMRGIGNLGVGNNTNDESNPRTGRLGVNHLPRIPEIGNEYVKETSPDEVKFRNHEGGAGFDNTAEYSFPSWNDSGSDSPLLSQNGGLSNRPTMLTHHRSLPRTSTEMAAIEKLLQFQDTVPCKVRAKRGCATHPRSIAERERRNRISERMRKLQELVPNMDKQTNIADMLDLAVDYVKKLQEEFNFLSSDRAKCKCPNLQ